MKQILLSNGIIVSNGQKTKSDILIEDEKIIKIEKDLMFGSLLKRAEAEFIDADGCYVFPGFIDAHTHVDMQTETVHTSDTFETATKAALSGGTTTIIDFTTQKKGETFDEAFDNWLELAENKSSCNYAFHMAITDWQPALLENSETNPERNADTPTQLQELLEKGITSVKVYMAYDTLRLSDPQIFEILTLAKELGILVSCHCENGDMVNRLTEEELANNHTRPSSHPISRPSPVEAEAIARFLSLAQMANVPVHIVHLSTKEGLEQIKLARKRGQQFYVETCPQYLTLTDSLYRKGRFEGAKWVCSPPLRKKQDNKTLLKDLAKFSPEKELCAKDNSLIQTVSTAHCSFNFKGDKELGKKDFSKIPNGLPGVQNRAQLLFTVGNIDIPEYALEKGSVQLDATQFSALMSENQAKIFGMYPERGCIQEGSFADITVWDPKHTEIITIENSMHNCDYTPYEGMEVRGNAKYVLLNGEIVAKNGTILKEKSGQYIARNPLTF